MTMSNKNAAENLSHEDRVKGGQASQAGGGHKLTPEDRSKGGQNAQQNLSDEDRARGGQHSKSGGK
jgi:hypothetical protein